VGDKKPELESSNKQLKYDLKEAQSNAQDKFVAKIQKEIMTFPMRAELLEQTEYRVEVPTIICYA
jgi:uncharacterized protein YaaW (UPF0174 family)